MINSGDKELCKHAFDLAQNQCKEKRIYMTDSQLLAVLSHISAMVHRSLTGEKLIGFDHKIFASVSDESLSIARKVKDLLDGLEEDEIYLLSIHFEAAKENLYR
ncbi:PRD domain-containing protein [Oceanobacillus manasiensis]|uniref:PRD domain-containing protein n=1 Tax=Oceanobacillus manasiensis TaxID=586413 RepID=UPI0005A7DC1E|nr:PRD domain-containing protein [Oceanobacillus manasiensis]